MDILKQYLILYKFRTYIPANRLFIFYQNSCVEILISNVIVLGDENFGMLLGCEVILGCEVTALMYEINALERSFIPSDTQEYNQKTYLKEGPHLTMLAL